MSQYMVLLVTAALTGAIVFAQEPASFAIADDWDVSVEVPGGASQRVHVTPPRDDRCHR